ncbi:hypothetical protein RRG08_030877 [Elysia crispata]|uniref:Uncharacterized protein n=1 Tax=Elysia crispata TaxID=231223 RepID=A0AAE0XT15_9GAST|nr:hypothetical protein RRG08_030877 [Elysia crispata]
MAIVDLVIDDVRPKIHRHPAANNTTLFCWFYPLARGEITSDGESGSPDRNSNILKPQTACSWDSHDDPWCLQSVMAQHCHLMWTQVRPVAKQSKQASKHTEHDVIVTQIPRNIRSAPVLRS